MLLEPVTHMLCDSGDDNGRHYQRNAKRSFNDEPMYYVRCEFPEEPLFMRSLYWFLIEQVKYDHEMTERFLGFSNSNNMKNFDWSDCMEAFAKKHGRSDYEWDGRVNNAYNDTPVLDQNFMYNLFETRDGKEYTIISIHGGADPRSGYTKPKVFSLNDQYDGFLVGMLSIDAGCNCIALSGERGSMWYGSAGCCTSLPTFWKADKSGIRCEQCGETVLRHLDIF